VLTAFQVEAVAGVREMSGQFLPVLGSIPVWDAVGLHFGVVMEVDV
jgi:hypothetical protein